MWRFYSMLFLKCAPNEIDELKERYRAVDAPYNMNRKYWISIRFNDDMADKEIKYWVRKSYDTIRHSLK